MTKQTIIKNKILETLKEYDANIIESDFKKFLDEEFESAKSYKPNKVDWLDGTWSGFKAASLDARKGKTSVKESDLLNIGKQILTHQF